MHVLIVYSTLQIFTASSQERREKEEQPIRSVFSWKPRQHRSQGSDRSPAAAAGHSTAARSVTAAATAFGLDPAASIRWICPGSPTTPEHSPQDSPGRHSGTAAAAAADGSAAAARDGRHRAHAQHAAGTDRPATAAAPTTNSAAAATARWASHSDRIGRLRARILTLKNP